MGLPSSEHPGEENGTSFVIENFGAAVLDASAIVTFVSLLLVGADLNAVSVRLALLEVPMVETIVRKGSEADSVWAACFELSFKVISIRRLVLTKSMWLVEFPLAGDELSASKRNSADSMLQI